MTERADAHHHDLVAKLRTMIEQVPVGKLSTIHHLFGILYASQLRDMRLYEMNYIAKCAGSKASMGREISRGRSLSQFVDVKPEYTTWPRARGRSAGNQKSSSRIRSYRPKRTQDNP